MEMPMCTSWMLKQLNGKTDRRANNMDKGELKCEN